MRERSDSRGLNSSNRLLAGRVLPRPKPTSGGETRCRFRLMTIDQRLEDAQPSMRLIRLAVLRSCASAPEDQPSADAPPQSSKSGRDAFALRFLRVKVRRVGWSGKFSVRLGQFAPRSFQFICQPPNHWVPATMGLQQLFHSQFEPVSLARQFLPNWIHSFGVLRRGRGLRGGCLCRYWADPLVIQLIRDKLFHGSLGCILALLGRIQLGIRQVDDSRSF